MTWAASLRRAGWLIAAVVLSAAAAWITGGIVERRARAAFAVSVAADARLRQALLASERARFHLLPMALADDIDLLAALHGTPGAARLLDRKLERLAANTGAAAIYVVADTGLAIAASNWRSGASFVGQDYRFRRYYHDALRTGAGEQFALGTVSRKPGLYLSRRTRGGVVVVKLEFDRIERQWRAAGGITYVTDRAGMVLVTSRPDWRFTTTRPIPPRLAAMLRTDSGAATLRRAPLWRDGGLSILATTRADPTGWQVHLLMPTRTAVGSVTRTAQVAAALASLALFGLGWALRERARRRSERTQKLEEAVAERTAALRREIEERAAAEARAAELREGLRQANRLATLGQITASVAHETAQPVAAIRNYAATGEQLLDRGATEEVRGNLRAIARLTERIGTVTAELRGFARKGDGAIQPIALGAVIDGARLILKERLAGIVLDLPPIPEELNVFASRVRLEQVLVNLLQNAIEALAEVAEPRIVITVAMDGGAVRLTVQDNGAGVAPAIAARIFTPFVTSRPAGLGLGLVIAQDIMIDLGGALSLIPSPAGACFELRLRRAP